MSKRDIERAEMDRVFEAARQSINKMSDAELCIALRNIPHRKLLQVAKDEYVMIGALVHCAAQRIENFTPREVFTQATCEHKHTVHTGDWFKPWECSDCGKEF